MKKLLPRSEYKKHLDALQGACAFCGMSDDLNVIEYPLWIWAYAAFPYRKYHTLLISKRHISRFSELDPEELIELGEIVKKVEDQYRHSKIVSKDSKFGDQLFISWRTRESDEQKKSVAHLHVHVYPKFASEDEIPLAEDAWDIDITKLNNN